LNNQGEVEGLEALSLFSRQAVKRALASGRVETPAALAELNVRSGNLMGGSEGVETFAVLEPVGTIVRHSRPRLSWQTLPGASRYTVTVLNSNLQVVATSPPLSTTAWTVSRPLERGGVYTWEVSALKEGNEIGAPAAPAPEARFKVLEKAKEDELKRAEQTSPRSHLLRGVLYAQAGLLIDAERELRALVNINPQSPLARKLLQSVRRSKK
jgi:hypothetical protein